MPRNSLKILLALIAGAVNPLAFAPFGWWPLGLVSIAALFGIWLTVERMAAARLGFAYGVGMFGVGTSWMYVSLHTFGGMPPVLAGLCILLLVLAVSLLPAAAGFLQGCFPAHGNTLRVALVMPGVWLLVEWLRGWVLSGFPWLTTGYALLETPLAGFAPVGGVYLVGLVALVTAGVLLAVMLDVSRGNLLLALLTGLGWGGGWHLSGVPWTQAAGAPISVAIVQNNVPLSLKWDQTQTNAIIADYFAASARHQDANLVVWPEAAVPDYLDRLPAAFYQQLRAHPADFIFGVLTRKIVDHQWRYYNSIAAIGQPEPGYTAPAPNLYHKQHLVPFGEFLPVAWLFRPLMAMLNIPMTNFTPWREPQKPLRAAGNFFAASVCYEDAFPGEARSQTPASGVLVNLSEDMWFGDSLAPHQRLQMARFRSLESGRPMIRASNNGLSSVINWRGGIDVIAPQFVKTTLTAQVQPRTGVTPYTVHGDLAALVVAGLLLLPGLLFRRPRLR